MKHFFATTTAFLSCSVALYAQELPAADALKALVAEQLPGYWSVVDLSVVATSRGGDAAQPKAVIRFEAAAKPSAPLFAQAGEEGPFVLVVPTQTPDDSRTLYGFADLGYRAGTWSGAVEIENPIDGLGQPIAMFTKPALELGSEAATARLAALRDQTVGQAAAAQEAEVARLKAAHQSARATLEKAHADQLAKLQAEQAEALRAADAARVKALNDMRSARGAEIAGLETQLVAERDALAKRLADARAKGEAEVAALERDYKAKLDELTTGNEPAVVAARAERERLLAAESETTSAALAEVRRANEAELEKLQAEHALKRGELLTRQLQEMAELETRLATERRSLERQLENAQEVMALQTKLLAAMSQRQQFGDRVFEAFELERRQRIASLSTIPRNWVGTVECVESEGRKRKWSQRVRLCFNEVRSDGFEGAMYHGELGDRSDACSRGYGGNPQSVTISMAADYPALPLQVNLVSSERLDWINVTKLVLAINADGKILGNTTSEWSIDNLPVRAACSYRLSAP